MVALAAHKLLEDVMHDAMQIQRIRPQSGAAPAHENCADDGGPGGQVRLHCCCSPSRSAVLTHWCPWISLKEYGINICKPEYISDYAQ